MPHDGPGEHYHDLGERVAAQDDAVVWTTVGLDIGSSTSQAIFSRITLARNDAFYEVVERAILHESEVILTPYAARDLIDGRRLGEFFEREFIAARLSRQEIDAGAVILTGLALTTRNSRAIADMVADESGKFVSVSAGDLLEARLAANGAGLPAISARHKNMILHADIGGGTTKLSTWRSGKLLRLAAIDVGARLLTVLSNGRIATIEPPMLRIAERLGIRLRIGDILPEDAAEILAAGFALEILRFGGVVREPPRDPALLRTPPLDIAGDCSPVEAVIVSGGVSEYIYGRETRNFGDLGTMLGSAMRRAIDESGIKLLECERGIRATVLGASQHSVQLSGNTIYVSDASCLPLRNLPVALLNFKLADSILEGEALQGALSEALQGYRVPEAEKRGVAVALRWAGSPTYRRLEIAAGAIAGALQPYLADGYACVVIVDGDVAGLLGASLRRHVAETRPVICLDGVHVHEFDYVDVGEFSAKSRALPVVVKSLLFAKTEEHIDARH
jgi:ethanolamine utilization protein EutA